MSTTVTPAEILNDLDLWGDMFLVNDRLVANNKATINGGYIYGNGTPVAGTGDQAYINALMNVNASIFSTPLHIKENLADIQGVFSALAGWITQNSGTSSSTLDGYLSFYNSTPYSYLVSPQTAIQYYLAGGNSPILTTAPSTILTPSNVFAPAVQFGSATVGAAAAITYTDYLSVPTSNVGRQTLTIANASGGTFTPTFVVSGSNVSTSAITWTGALAAATIQTAVNATSIGANQIIVSGANGGPWYFDLFGSKFVNTTVKAITVASALTGTGATAVITPTVNASFLLTVGATGGTLGFTLFGQAGTIAYTGATTAAALQTAMIALKSIGTGNLTATGSAGGPYTVTLTGILANQYAAPFTVDASALTGGAQTATVQQLTLGSQQGYTPPTTTKATITITINNTLVVQATFDGWDSTGAVVTGRTANATLSSLTAGSTATFTPTTGGDRIRHITGIASTSGSATAGAFTVGSVTDRTPL